MIKKDRKSAGPHL